MNEEKYQQLQNDYYTLEEEHRKLQHKIKWHKRIRRFFDVLLITFVVWYFWTPITEWQGWTIFKESTENAEDIAYDSEGNPLGKMIAVKKEKVTDTLEMSGKIESLELIRLLSPMNAIIQEKRFEHGDFVEKGEVIIVLDTTQEETEYRTAQVEYMEALEESKKLHDWNNHLDVIRAYRNVEENRLALEANERELQETQILFDKGIDSASNLETAQTNLRKAKTDFQTAKEDLKTTLAKGSKDNIEKVDLKLENARLKVAEIKARLAQAKILSPHSGLLLFPDNESAEVTQIEVGTPVELNQVLCVVENMEGLKIKAQVEEMDILKLKLGQTVKIKGDAFPNITLTGSVTEISSRAEGNDAYSSSSVSKFPITVTVSELEKSHRETLRLGMSAEMEVVVYEDENALVVPFAAIAVEEEKRWVQVFDSQKKTAEKVEIETGATTLDSVEVLSGLKEGDLVLVEIEVEEEL